MAEWWQTNWQWVAAFVVGFSVGWSRRADKAKREIAEVLKAHNNHIVALTHALVPQSLVTALSNEIRFRQAVLAVRERVSLLVGSKENRLVFVGLVETYINQMASFLLRHNAMVRDRNISVLSGSTVVEAIDPGYNPNDMDPDQPEPSDPPSPEVGRLFDI